MLCSRLFFFATHNILYARLKNNYYAESRPLLYYIDGRITT